MLTTGSGVRDAGRQQQCTMNVLITILVMIGEEIDAGNGSCVAPEPLGGPVECWVDRCERPFDARFGISTMVTTDDPRSNDMRSKICEDDHPPWRMLYVLTGTNNPPSYSTAS